MRRQARRGDAVDIPGHMRRDAVDQRLVAARVVQRMQAQGHRQQPGQRHAAGRQRQALPDRVAVAGGAPAHQPQPGQGAQQGQHEGEQAEFRLIALGQLADVGQELGRPANLQRGVVQPQEDRAGGEEEHREPVEQRARAALEGRQREARQHRQRRQREQHGAVVGAHQQAGQQRHQRGQQRHGQVAPHQVRAPAPQRPGRQRPGRPAEPAQQAQPVQHAAFAGLDAPGPAMHRPGHERRQRHRAEDPRQELAGVLVGRAVAEPQRADGQRQRDGRRAAGREHRQRGEHRGARLPSAEGERREAVDEEGDAQQLEDLGRDLVAQAQQADAGDQRQQAAVGHGAGVVDRMGLATEGEGDRLGGLGAGQVQAAVPGQRQHRRQHQAEGDACRHRGLQEGQQLDAQRADPVGQQAAIRGQAGDRGLQPRRMALRDAGDEAVGGEIGVAPRVTAEQAGQHVGRAQQQQGPARDRVRAALGHDGRGGQIHARLSRCRCECRCASCRSFGALGTTLLTAHGKGLEGRDALYRAGATRRRRAGWEGVATRGAMKKGSRCGCLLRGDRMSIRSGRALRPSCAGSQTCCGTSRRGHPGCRRSSACRCRTGAIRWRFPA